MPEFLLILALWTAIVLFGLWLSGVGHSLHAWLSSAPRPIPPNSTDATPGFVIAVSILDDGIVIMKVTGRLILGGGIMRFRSAMREQIAQGRRKLVLDLSDVKYIDASGMGELVSGITATLGVGGNAVLVVGRGRIANLMKITAMGYLIFFLYNSLDEALHALRANEVGKRR